MPTLYDFDTLLQFATEMVTSETSRERRNVLKRFNPPERCVSHPQSVLLRKIAGAIKANGSWHACSPLCKQLIEEDFNK